MKALLTSTRLDVLAKDSIVSALYKIEHVTFLAIPSHKSDKLNWLLLNNPSSKPLTSTS